MLGDPSWISPQHVHLKANMAAILVYELECLLSHNGGPSYRLGMPVLNACQRGGPLSERAAPTPRNFQLRFLAISIQQTLQRQRPGASSTPPSGGRSPWQRPEQKRKRADSRWSRLLFSGVAFTRADGDMACIRGSLSVRFKRQSHTNKGV